MLTTALVSFSLLLLSEFASEVKGESASNVDWDVLIFTQQWPATTCYHWKEGHKNRSCSLPSETEFWTIHGVWPTKFGTIGPSFCNKSADFEYDKLKPIVPELNTFWRDLEKNSTDHFLWKHEWLKHGTCAALLEELNSEIKYFEQGLNWRTDYVISHLLGSSGIHPDSEHTVVAFNMAIKKIIGKNPSIHCVYDKKHNVSYLSEIHLCFDKNLQITDCDGVLGGLVAIDYPGGTVNTNCHISLPVRYPSMVPAVKGRPNQWKFPFVNLYKLVNFVMWLTL